MKQFKIAFTVQSVEDFFLDLAAAGFDWPMDSTGKNRHFDPVQMYAPAKWGETRFDVKFFQNMVQMTLGVGVPDEPGYTPPTYEDRGLHCDLLISGKGAETKCKQIRTHFKKATKANQSVPTAIKTKFGLKDRVAGVDKTKVRTQEMRKVATTTRGTSMFILEGMEKFDNPKHGFAGLDNDTIIMKD